MNNLLMKDFIKELLEKNDNVESVKTNEEEEVFFTRENFLKKLELIETISKYVDNPMLSQMSIMVSIKLLVESVSTSIENDIERIINTLMELELKSSTISGFIKYLMLDIDGEADKMVDDTKYLEIWEEIGKRQQWEELE